MKILMNLNEYQLFRSDKVHVIHFEVGYVEIENVKIYTHCTCTMHA